MKWEPGQHLTIRTERLVLKTMTPGDITPDYISWFNDDELQNGLGRRGRGWDRARAEKHVSKFDRIKGFHFGIFLKETGRLIGYYTMTRDPIQKFSSSTSLIGDKGCWRKGYAKEISQAMIGFRFRVMDIEKIESKVRGENPASIALLETLGFKKEGILVKQDRGPDRTLIDTTLYGLLKEEWLAGQEQKRLK